MSDNAENSNKSMKLIVVAGIIVIALLLVVILVLLLKKDNQEAEKPSEEKRPVLITEENAEQVVEEMIAESSTEVPQSYQVSMTTEWTFKDGESESYDAYVINQKVNTTPIYFDIIIDGSDEVIYQSPVIPVGKSIDKIKLDKDLDAGKYDCIMVYHLLDDDQNTLTTVNIALAITVQE